MTRKPFTPDDFKGFTHPEVDPVPDPIGQSRVDGFIELEQDLKSQLRGDLLGLERTSAATFSQSQIRARTHTLQSSARWFKEIIFYC